MSSPSKDCTSSPAEGCMPSPLEGYASSFSVCSISTPQENIRSFALRCFTETCAPDYEGPVVSFQRFLGHPLILEGDQLCEHIQRGRLSCIPGQDFTRSAAKRRVQIMRINMTTLIWIWMMLLFSNILPSDHNVNLPLQMYQLVCAVMT